MERLVERKIDAPQVEATIIDGAVIVQIVKPGIRMATSFKEYSQAAGGRSESGRCVGCIS